MKAKTLKELNEKVWYRFLKVIFILGLVFSVLLVGATIFSVSKPKQISDYRITCNYGNKESFTAREKGIYYSLYSSGYKPLSSSDLSLVSESAKERMSFECGHSKEELRGLANHILAGESYDPLYKIDNIEYTEGTWMSVIFYIFIGVFVTVLLYESIRRCFYYVLIGSLLPPRE